MLTVSTSAPRTSAMPRIFNVISSTRSVILGILIHLLALPAPAATTVEVQTAVAKGAQYLRSIYPMMNGGEKTLVALTIYKADGNKNGRELTTTLNEILAKFDGDTYEYGGDHLYEAGVEATLLSDLDAVKYKPQLQILADVIISEQMDTGGWDYPNGGHGKDSVGDTSVIQYACLGLWACERAGVQVDPQVWERVLLWHAKYQNDDGGFSYCPGLTTGDGRGASMLNMSVNAVGNMHIAMLHLDPKFLPLEQRRPTKQASPDDEPPKFGFLEAVEVEAPEESRAKQGEIPDSSITAVRRAFGFVTARFDTFNRETGHKSYYYYSLERMASLANIEKIGDREWFNSCADFLISEQQPTGGWDIKSVYTPQLDSAFCVLFLTRSTGRLLKRVATPQLGQGLLAGGRGLPDDLTSVDFNGRTIVAPEGPVEPLDKLLASLKNTGNLDFLDVQEQIVEKVQLGDRETLIGQVDQLLELVDHPDANIRRTVMWALGRTDRMDLARHLIDGLSDSDLGVMIEARNGLCWLSRKPKGFGYPIDPIADLGPDASEQQQEDAVATWHKRLVLTWGEWYLNNRPFTDRGDEFEAELRARMVRLQEGRN